MAFNFFNVLGSLFGDKRSRDYKAIKPIVDQVLAIYPEMQKLSNDELRQKSADIRNAIQESVSDKRAEIDALNQKIQETEIDSRKPLFDKIDSIEKDILDVFEKELDKYLPEVFAIVKDTARRFVEAGDEGIVVTATDFDRKLASSHDFVEIDGDNAIWHKHWVAGGNDTVWDMIHYDVQLFGGVVLPCGHPACVPQRTPRQWRPRGDGQRLPRQA